MIPSLNFRKCDLGLLLADRNVQEFLDVVHNHPEWSTEQLLMHISRDSQGKACLSVREVKVILLRLHFSTVFRRQFILARLREWEKVDNEGRRQGYGEKVSAEYLLYVRYRRLYKEGTWLPRQTQNALADPSAEVKSKLSAQVPIQVSVRKAEVVGVKRKKSVLSLLKKFPVAFTLQAVKAKSASTVASTVAKAMVDKKEEYSNSKDNVEVVRGRRVEEIITPVLSLAKQLRVQVGARTLEVKEPEESLPLPKISVEKQAKLFSKVKQVRFQFKIQAVVEKSAMVNKKVSRVGRVKRNGHFFSKMRHLRVNFGVKTVEVK